MPSPDPGSQRGAGLLIAMTMGAVLGGLLGVVWSQSRCYRRYQRLCHRWFSDDPGGELGCLERADDVCSW